MVEVSPILSVFREGKCGSVVLVSALRPKFSGLINPSCGRGFQCRLSSAGQASDLQLLVVEQDIVCCRGDAV